MTVISNLEDFWIDKIEKLQTDKLVSDFLMDDFNWKRTLQSQKPYYSEISVYGEKIVREVYDKATINITPAPVGLTELLLDLPANDEGKSALADYTEIIQENLTYWGGKCEEARKETDLFQKIIQRIIKNVLRYELKEDDLPKSQINPDPREYFHHLKNNVLKKRSIGKILKSERRLTKRLENRENQIRKACDLTANATIPDDWENFFYATLNFTVKTLGVNDPTNLPTIPAGENLATLLARPIQTQLDNANDWIDDLEKVFKEILEIAPTDALPDNLNDLSDLYKNQSGTQTIKQLKTKADKADTLQTWKDTHNCLDGHTCPDCNLTKHNDYDTIKSERDTLKTENTQLKEHKCDCASKVAEKETQIITKIITDLQLSTERERERENLLEAVITEIKTKITPPTDNSADKQKITELETKLANLQSPKSLTDLPISQEVKAEVIKISQELGLTAQSCAKLENATSYQELANFQKEAYQEKLSSEIASKESANYLNWGLGALSLGSLLILAWILIKKTTFTPEIGGKKDK